MALIITLLFHFISICSGSCTELYNVGMPDFKLFFLPAFPVYEYFLLNCI